MIPMFLNLCNGACLDITTSDPLIERDMDGVRAIIVPVSSSNPLQSSSASHPLPPIMGERLVRVRHSMRIILLLDCVSPVAGGIQNFVSETVDKRLFTSPTGIRNNPPDGQTVAASSLVDFNRHLVC